VQIYQQKVKHLLYEQQNNITTLKADTELALKLQQDEFVKREAELNRDKRALKQELREQVWLMASPAAGGLGTWSIPCSLWSASSCDAHITACRGVSAAAAARLVVICTGIIEAAVPSPDLGQYLAAAAVVGVCCRKWSMQRSSGP
jgi:hypothetical protein